ncbi:hypothetical protein Ocin01_18521 [Orchesella cincta]|uniref:Uncharacterized protein n=1 Tax=Orchesella cincta TaxID=48709 RepID=A0A1D2M5B6_ORCCI|nr:hypothetical protein Ocin01_18521 [Orchesella cincta]
MPFVKNSSTIDKSWMPILARTNEMGINQQYAFGALAHEATEVCFGILDADALDVVVSAAAFKY